MTTETPAQTVQRLFPLLAEGRTAEAAALFADSVAFAIPHPAGIPWVPDVDSAAGMRTFFELLGTHVRPKSLDVHRIVADGEDVVLLGRMVSEVKRTGRDIDTAFALHTTVRDGKITRYHLYEDTHAVARAYYGDAATPPGSA
jgi:ketosteroid isomerase-like protein